MIATSPREPASAAALAAATAGRVLVVDDHRQARESMAEVLRTSGHQVACCSSAAEALQVLQSAAFDCIVTDLKMPGMSGLELIVQLRQRRTAAQVVMVTAHATVSSAVEAMRHGAFDYIEKPFDADALERLVGQAIRHGRLVRPEAASAGPGGAEPVMLGSSPAMQALRARIAQVYGFSGHADRAGLLRWLSHFRQPPRQLFLTHGEEQVSLELADQIRQSMGWEVTVPSYQQTVEL